MKEKMNRKNLITAGLAVLVVCLIMAVFYSARPGTGIEIVAMEETTEPVTERITVPEIAVAETTTEADTEEIMKETETETMESAVEETLEASEEERESPAAPETQPVKVTKSAVKEAELKPQVPEEVTAPVREPEPQEVEPDHEEGEQATAKPEEPQGGTTNDQGQVYVPGFGYVETGGGVTEMPAHSDGDWNKQVGTMQ